MGEPRVLALASITELADINGLYFLTYSWLFGMSLWVTFFGGVIAYKALPRQQFGALQHKTFPVYFFISIVQSLGLLGYWAWTHPTVLSHPTSFVLADNIQAYVIALVAIYQSGNYFVIGPYTSKVMFRRHKLEKAEGKAYNEAGVSAEMKSINKLFGQLHGISSLLNLGSFILLAFHGLWLAKHGISS